MSTEVEEGCPCGDYPHCKRWDDQAIPSLKMENVVTEESITAAEGENVEAPWSNVTLELLKTVGLEEGCEHSMFPTIDNENMTFWWERQNALYICRFCRGESLYRVVRKS